VRSARSRRHSLAALLVVLPLAACQAQEPGSPPAAAAQVAFGLPQAGRSWAPAPVDRAGLRTLAESRGGTLALHTATGDVTFWTGVNLGSTTPGHSPGQLAISAERYRSWFTQMGAMGVRVLRVYTIHGPQMYEELRRYNLAHVGAPLYLSQGVYLPDESYTRTRDLYEVAPTRAFTRELQEASAAVHGDLLRPQTPGRASGRWTADVSPWLASWIIGVELDPIATAASDRYNSAAPEHIGRYFSSRADATPTTPTERWLAARMDELATAEAARGTSAPVAFVNWPTTDPLRHPTEPLASEDLVGVDANHITAAAAWPAGTFASYHAYPYYPDFLRHEPAYQQVGPGGPDQYAAYLADLKAHHTGMPVLISEFGVPSSIGSAHLGSQGRDQGDHSEQEALTMDAALLRVISDVGLAGGLLFSWTDEWFKFTWNTVPRQSVVDPERRALWHDPLTNEQWFGLLAQDPVGSDWRTVAESPADVQRVDVRTDESFVELKMRLERPLDGPLRLGFDIVPGGRPLPGGGGEAVHDVAVALDPAAGTGVASVRSEVDPVKLDGLATRDVPVTGPDGWAPQRLTINRAFTIPVLGTSLPAEFLPVGELRRGSWDPAAADYDSRATWQVDGQDVRLRLPWSMLLLADPSSRTAVVPVQGRPVGVPVAQVAVVADTGRGVRSAGAVRWETWQTASSRERLKVGVQPFVDAMAELGR